MADGLCRRLLQQGSGAVGLPRCLVLPVGLPTLLLEWPAGGLSRGRAALPSQPPGHLPRLACAHALPATRPTCLLQLQRTPLTVTTMIRRRRTRRRRKRKRLGSAGAAPEAAGGSAAPAGAPGARAAAVRARRRRWCRGRRSPRSRLLPRPRRPPKESQRSLLSASCRPPVP